MSSMEILCMILLGYWLVHISALGWIAYDRRRLLDLRAGRLLLRASMPKRRLGTLVGIGICGYFLATGPVIGQLLGTEPIAALVLLLNPFVLIGVPIVFNLGGDRIELREQGIFHDLDFIPWGSINQHGWVAGSAPTLVLYSELGEYRFEILAEECPTVDQTIDEVMRERELERERRETAAMPRVDLSTEQLVDAIVHGVRTATVQA